MEKTIVVEIKSNFGNRAVYPYCRTAKLLAQLTGTKTFTDIALDSIKALGYEIKVMPQSL